MIQLIKISFPKITHKYLSQFHHNEIKSSTQKNCPQNKSKKQNKINIYIQFKQFLKSQMNHNTKLTISQLPIKKKLQIDTRNKIKKIRQSKFTINQQQYLNDISIIYGSAMAMMIRYQRGILGQPERLPGLRSSFMLLQSNMGRLTTLDFEDVMGKDKNLLKTNAHDQYLSQFD